MKQEQDGRIGGTRFAIENVNKADALRLVGRIILFSCSSSVRRGMKRLYRGAGVVLVAGLGQRGGRWSFGSTTGPVRASARLA